MTAGLITDGVLDVDALLAFHRATFGNTRMTAGGPGDNPPAPPAPPADPPVPTDEPRTMTQAELTALATREKQQGAAAARREVADTLGVTVEQAATIIKSHRDAEQAQLTEAQRREQAAAEAETAAKAREQAATAATHATAVERVLLRSGLALPADADQVATDEFVTAAVGLVRADPGADDAAIRAAVDKLKATVPALFTPGTPTLRIPGSDPGHRPPATQTPGQYGSQPWQQEAIRRGFVDKDGNPVKQPA